MIVCLVFCGVALAAGLEVAAKPGFDVRAGAGQGPGRARIEDDAHR
jgi:hypothetical protein